MGKEVKELTEAQRIRRIREKGEEYGWEFYMGENKWNFHLITQEGIRIGRTEYKTPINHVMTWYVIRKDGSKFEGSYNECILVLVEDYNKYRSDVIHL